METNIEYVKRRVRSGAVNVAELSRRSGVSIWTIHPLKQGRRDQMLAETADRLAAALREHFPEEHRLRPGKKRRNT